MKRRNLTTPIVYLIMLGIIVLLVSGFDLSGDKVKKISYSEFIDDVRGGRIQAAEVTELKLVGLYSDSKISMEVFPQEADFYTYIPSVDILKDDMDKVTAELTGREANDITQADYPFSLVLNPAPGPSILETLLPYILLFGGLALFYVLMTRAQGGGNNIMNFGKSRARTNMDGRNKVTFADVAGAEEEKEELREVVEFMRSPKRFTAMGARIPKGCLLVGPPGTGKTLLAKAVAGEAGVPFFSISGSDFVEMFVGVGASRVRDLFNTAKKCAPAVVFIDEIDAVGRQRGAGLGGGHDEREQTLNQLLVEMDGFAVNEGIIVLAATNRPDVLDPALLRPGRFDRQVQVNLPDAKGREEILKVHARGKIFAKGVSLKNISSRTVGFSGADLENLLNEAALLAVRRNKESITMAEIDEAHDRVLMGPAKKSKKYTDHDKKLVAYHEAGHAVLGIKLDGANDVQKITIIPRGYAGGYTMMLPKEERFTATKQELLERITGLLGGRVAEELVFNEITTGAHNDFEQATKIVRAMVTEYGMSSLGPLQLEQNEGSVFLGRDYNKSRNFSSQVAYEIDQEMRKIIDECYKKAQKIIKENRDLLDLIADTLITKETLTKEEIDYLVEHKCLPDEEKELTLEELKNIAKEKKIKGYTKMTKEELQKVIDSTED